MRRSLTGALLVVPLLLSGACGDEARPGPRPSYAPDEVVLRVEVPAVQAPFEYVLTQLPVVTVYGDGRVVTEGPNERQLPDIVVRTISDEDVRRLVTLAVDAGVGQDRDWGSPTITDMPSTRFTVLTDAGRLETTVYALGDDHGLSSRERRNRGPLVDLWDRLADLPGTLGANAISPDKPYEPDAVAVINRQLADRYEAHRDWPGPALPGRPYGESGLACVVVTGPELPAVLAEATTAESETTWRWDELVYEARFRPLLPDESRCPLT